MANTPLKITIDPGGVSVVVTITQPSNLSFTAYSTLNGSTPVTFPQTITQLTTYYMDTPHRYNVSLIGPQGENGNGSGGVAALDLRGGQSASLGYFSSQYALASQSGSGSSVTSFNTRTGAVTLTKADVTSTGLTYSDVNADQAGAATAAQAAAQSYTDTQIAAANPVGSKLYLFATCR